MERRLIGVICLFSPRPIRPAASGASGSSTGGDGGRREADQSTNDPEARLYRKGKRQAARLCYLGHVLTETVTI